ncbi:MAG: methylmalonyl Co-A mutase-associated GTPase MeaB [Nitriliruptoraceae bacterium]
MTASAAPNPHDPVDLLTAARAGDRRAIARLMTLVERADDNDVRILSAEARPASETAWIIGITGAPGVGKSSLVAALIAEFRRRGSSVAVIAVDPSSPFSGGALLGDRIRMQDHYGDPGVFIRSMAARNHLGGIAAATPLAVSVLAAVGFDVVIVETVGVGQSELEIAATADTTIVVLAPGAGDGVQAAKAGILEIADIFAINKADLAGAGQVESALTTMLEVGHAASPGGDSDDRLPPIMRVVAVRSEGVGDLLDNAKQHLDWLRSHGYHDARRRARAIQLVETLAIDQVRSLLQGQQGVRRHPSSSQRAESHPERSTAAPAGNIDHGIDHDMGHDVDDGIGSDVGRAGGSGIGGAARVDADRATDPGTARDFDADIDRVIDRLVDGAISPHDAVDAVIARLARRGEHQESQ